MKKTVLIIDDEQIGCQNLERYLNNNLEDSDIFTAYLEDDIKNKISDLFYDIAIVDLRMDDFSFNGIDIIKEISEINPLTKIIVISAFTDEFSEDLSEVLQTGKILNVFNKEDFNVFAEKIKNSINDYFETNIDNQEDYYKEILQNQYSELKNEQNSQKKGILLERFTATLFRHIGFNQLLLRKKDKSMNEVDLILRNDIEDYFFNKFSPYFLVECKNISTNIDKNIFIIFKDKLENSSNMSKLGFIVTPKSFKRTAYLQALRSSNRDYKVIFISNIEISKLINSDNSLEELKKIIDYQSKDN